MEKGDWFLVIAGAVIGVVIGFFFGGLGGAILGEMVGSIMLTWLIEAIILFVIGGLWGVGKPSF